MFPIIALVLDVMKLLVNSDGTYFIKVILRYLSVEIVQ